MCGICGIYNFDLSLHVNSAEIDAMNETLRHRGPDDEGSYVDGPVGIGIRRLSIIDVAGGSQPLSNEDKTIWIVFNGEIYNYKDLRKSLIKKGHRFSSQSDTESIIHLYEEVGLDFVNQLRGMFAITIWDSRQNRLILARDRLGIKPLFYAQYNNSLVFASEMKAILQRREFSREMDENALAAYFTLSYIPAPLTIFKGIQKVLPGHVITVQDGKITDQEYWDIQFRPDRSKNEEYFIEGFMDLLQESVNMRLMSEVPLGAFLSGGIDSSTVVALMSKATDTPVNTFTIGFGGDTGGYLDERKYAQMVANRYATHHREEEVWPSPHGLIEKIVKAFDEPFADDSAIPSFAVYEAAKKDVTVALSGLGGDELFGGYERYLGFQLSETYKKFPVLLRKNIFHNFIERLPERQDGHYTINHIKRFVRSASLPADRCYLGFLSKMKNTLELFADKSHFREPVQACQDLIFSHFNSPNSSAGLNRAFYCDIKTYLPEDILALTDRLSMHHSLEVRVPFLDHKLLEFCATIPPQMKIRWLQKKYLLKKGVSDLLPRAVIRHRKQGFVGPMTRWLQSDLKSYAIETLSEDNLNKHGIFDPKTVQQILTEHFNRQEIHDTAIWSLLIFQTWYDLYIQNP